MENHEPWVEKYRPQNLKEFIQTPEITTLFDNMIKSKNCMHLLIHGNCGIGKTSIIRILANELYHDYIDEYVLELNASDDRGINVVRNKIISFSNKIVKYNDNKYKYPDFKLIILDEVDAMTIDAQNSLRIVIEETSDITRFCLICNDITSIIDSLQSRCALIKFYNIDKTLIFNHINNISQIENINISNECLHLIADYSNGDMRQAIMNLQCINYLSKTREITINYIKEIYGKDFTDNYYTLLNDIINNDCIYINEYITKIYEDGYNLINICKLLLEQLINYEINNNAKSEIILKIQNTIYNYNLKLDVRILLTSLFYFIKLKSNIL